MTTMIGVPLTERQAEVLDFIKRHKAEHGWPPTYREIMDAFEMQSPNSVRVHITALVKKGRIRIDPNTARGITIIEVGERCPTCGHELEV